MYLLYSYSWCLLTAHRRAAELLADCGFGPEYKVTVGTSAACVRLNRRAHTQGHTLTRARARTHTRKQTRTHTHTQAHTNTRIRTLVVNTRFTSSTQDWPHYVQHAWRHSIRLLTPRRSPERGEEREREVLVFKVPLLHYCKRVNSSPSQPHSRATKTTQKQKP